jgi:hypothetical protein
VHELTGPNAKQVHTAVCGQCWPPGPTVGGTSSLTFSNDTKYLFFLCSRKTCLL